ncbi:MAG: shikimate dehydrogenase [Anaeromyxobacter sp.]
MITGHTALYGLLGHPVSHTRSPEMQNTAFALRGVDAVYLALPVAPEQLAEAVRGAHALGFQGLNVTVPHKQPAAGLCQALDEVAREVGAVNTLRRTAAGWEGFNTDALAARTLLAAAGVGPGRKALLLGAGGAARAAAWALVRLGAELRIAARRPEAADELCAAMAPYAAGPAPRPAPWSALGALAPASDVVVNGTSIGLHGHPPRVEALAFRRGQLAVDWVYGTTAFAQAASEAGARVIRGEDLLVRQGALAFNLWTGREPPEAEMAAAIARPQGAH